MPIVGSGDFRYEPVPEWPRMPRYWSFGEATDAAINSREEIYIYGRGEHPLTLWDTEGNFITSWGEGTTSGWVHGNYVAPNDNVWLVDTMFHIVTEHAPDGTLLRTLGDKLNPSASFKGIPFNMPTGIAIGPNGNIFVSDGYGGHRVHKFSPEGEMLHSWGRQGDGPGEFANVHQIWVDRSGRVLVCDRENRRVQVFDGEGNFLDQWTDIQSPGDLWIKDDVVYLVEQGDWDAAVSIRTLDGEVITRWSGDDGPGKGTLRATHGICVDSQGSIYVTEIATSQRVRKFQHV